MSNESTATTRRLRDYQENAIACWSQADFRGILAMATGTGKTFTALEAVAKCLDSNPQIGTVLIVAPFQHLADQWCEELAHSGIRPVRAYESSARWQSHWSLELHRSKARGAHMFVVTTYATLGSASMLELLTPLAASLLVVADECHYLGSRRSLGFMSLPVPFRLGLSATPERHFDEEGTRELMDYFSGVVFSFGMMEAIEQGFLTPYNYYPEAVEMTGAEFRKYRELTDRISVAAAMAQQTGESENLDRLLMARARLMNNSSSKVSWLRNKIASLSPDELRYTLVYVGDILFDEVLELIGSELGISAHAFTAAQSRKQRAEILERFQSGDLSVLVAMKCLDEGVDVPPTRSAYFLASTSNPREFVQRRGRILRRSAGKTVAHVHDAIAVPPMGTALRSFDAVEQTTLKSQFARIQEFGLQAQNKFEADAALFRLRLAADLPVDSGTTGGMI